MALKAIKNTTEYKYSVIWYNTTGMLGSGDYKEYKGESYYAYCICICFIVTFSYILNTLIHDVFCFILQNKEYVKMK